MCFMMAVSKFFVPEPDFQNHLHFSEIDDVSFLECSLASVGGKSGLIRRH